MRPPKNQKGFINPFKKDKIPPNYITAAKKAIQEIEESTKKPFVQLSPGKNYKTESLDFENLIKTKIGGIPFWPKDMKYPQDKNHKDLVMIAQLNFDELPKLQNFPSTGILQFFCHSTYDVTGEEKVIYHLNPNIDRLDKTRHLTTLETTTKDDPINGVYYPKAKLDSRGLNATQDEYWERFISILNKELHTDWKQWSDVPDKIRLLAYEETMWYDGHQYGGYPYHIQNDFQRDTDNPSRTEVVLFQFDSEDGIRWGDDGCGQYYISKNDLIKKNFNNIEFIWSCG